MVTPVSPSRKKALKALNAGTDFENGSPLGEKAARNKRRKTLAEGTGISVDVARQILATPEPKAPNAPKRDDRATQYANAASGPSLPTDTARNTTPLRPRWRGGHSI